MRLTYRRKKILIIMTGSIASYKACQVLSSLSKLNYDLKVVLTKAVQKFIGESTIEGLTGRAPFKDLYEAGSAMEHIHLARWADLILVVPATANYINKISQGIADDLATTIFLAHDFSKPYLIVPAMNTSMYQHPVTQQSIKKLSNMGAKILETASGVLACGEVGWGKLLEPELIVQEVNKEIGNKNKSAKKNSVSLKKSRNAKKILITYGGTLEKIDDVRVIANTSSGQTGAFISNYILEMGYDLKVLRAQSSVESYVDSINEKTFVSTDDLFNLLKTELELTNYDAVIHLAAVSDFKIKNPIKGKISSNSGLNLELIKNIKIIDKIKKISKNKKIKLIGFKLLSNTDQLTKLEKVESLLKNSKADFVVANDTRGISDSQHGFEIFDYKNNLIFSGNNKFQLAECLIQVLSEMK